MLTAVVLLLEREAAAQSAEWTPAAERARRFRGEAGACDASGLV